MEAEEEAGQPVLVGAEGGGGAALGRLGQDLTTSDGQIDGPDVGGQAEAALPADDGRGGEQAGPLGGHALAEARQADDTGHAAAAVAVVAADLAAVGDGELPDRMLGRQLEAQVARLAALRELGHVGEQGEDGRAVG